MAAKRIRNALVKSKKDQRNCWYAGTPAIQTLEEKDEEDSNDGR